MHKHAHGHHHAHRGRGGPGRWARFARHRGGPGGPFGIRRPLRFLAHKLELDEGQIGRVAEVLDDLKTERAQAAVDDRRAQKLFAESVTGEGFDAAKAKKAAKQRADSAERVNGAIVDALSLLHAELTDAQREKLALLIRTGPLVL